MSQSEDNVSYNLWSNFELWNNHLLNDSSRSGLWSLGCQLTASNDATKLNGLASTAPTELGELPKLHTVDSLNSLPSWAPFGSVLQDVDIPSIWSTSDLDSPPNHTLSLSGTSIHWQPTSINSNDIVVPNSCVAMWDGVRHSAPSATADVNVGPSPWYEPQPPKEREPSNSSSDAGSISVHSCLLTDSGIATLASNRSDILPVSCMVSTPCSFTPLADDDSSKVYCRSTDPPIASLATFSSEQLCDHLINATDGWGKRPIDQITSWESTDPCKSIDGIERSGLATPTPGSRSHSGPTASYRPLHSHKVESNVWTNEPPTGTGIWEMHCDSCNMRGTSWNPSLNPLSAITLSSDVPPAGSNPLPSLNNIGAAAVEKSCHPHPSVRATGTHRSWEPYDKLWPTSNGTSVSGRPLLGNTRLGSVASPLEELSGWSQDLVPPNIGLVDGDRNFASWELSGTNTSSQCDASASTGISLLSSGMLTSADTLRRQQIPSMPTASQVAGERMLVHPFSNTYRADLVKYLMSQGFKKEDVQAALIDCNMEPERALHELRERYPSYSSYQHSDGNAVPQIKPLNGFLIPGPQVPPPTSTNSTMGSNLCTSILNNFPIIPGSTNPANQLSSLGAHPNQQLIRQQITQQLRSALNLSIPNSLPGTACGNQSAVFASGNSLLGQPPPPLLCGTGMSPIGGSNLTVSCSGYLPSQFKNGVSSTPRFTSTPKRSDRQMSIIASMQELHKKHQSIQQQVNMYKNNPAMCSQPQYADVFAELQGQLQQIEAQLKAKQVQLNMACAQDCTTSTRVQTFGVMADRLQNGGNSNSSIGSSPHRRLPNQDQLTQQFMDLHVRSGASVNADSGDGEFPIVGTWTSYTKNGYEATDRMCEGIASKPHIAVRPVLSRHNQLSNFSGSWQPSGVRVTHSSTTPCWRTNGATRQLNSIALPKNQELYPVSSNTDQQYCPSSGQWLLVQPLNVNGLAHNPTTLHHILLQFGLTHFRVLNAITGCVLVHLHSKEFALQLIRSLGDRFSIEAISDPDLLTQLQQRAQTCTSSLGLTSEPGTVALGAYGVSQDQHSSISSNGIFGSKKPGTHAGRLGVMVSGIH